jgi:hypothetical protein
VKIWVDQGELQSPLVLFKQKHGMNSGSLYSRKEVHLLGAIVSVFFDFSQEI